MAGSGALANSKASRQSWAAARPIFDTPLTCFFARLEQPRLPATVGDSGRAARPARWRPLPRRRRRCRLLSASGPHHRSGIGKRLRQAMDENQLRPADADDVARLQGPVAADPLGPHQRAVAAVQVAEHPLPAGNEDLQVVAAAALVLEHDLVGRRTTDGDGLSGDEPEDVAPFRPFTNDEIG